jgi:N-acetylated-alpha-linked acidic dipeptidase
MRRVLPLTPFCLLFASSVLLAQSETQRGAQAGAEGALPGYSTASTARERMLEARLASATDTASARSESRRLSAVPHVAGTPAQQATAEYVLRRMRSFGLDTSRADFKVYIPFPDSTIVERLTPSPLRLRLEEPALPEDSTSQRAIWPAMNGTAGSGDVTAPLIYVNYGLPADYAVLDSLGVRVGGAIVIARYGRSFRGIKAREAERRGAAALILFSDPEDDGYMQGDVYPEGPMRHPDAPQRGSVFNGNGDPSTPDWASTPGAARLPPDSMDIPHIPVVPIGYRNAALLLEPLRGPAIPQAWQGGLPFRYHIGSGEVKVRVGLWHEQGDRAYKRITDTFGMIKGTDWPDEMVLVGGHRDAWGPGAQDNVSGVVSILEAARAWGDALKRGIRPRRTLVFATWDAEEWGLVGSTEWVESMEDRLRTHAVAYLNLDVSASGRSFGASGTASLHPMIREITRLVAQPGDTVSVYAAWRMQGHLPDTADVALGELGGGSDFGGFYNHLGIPSFDFGFGGPGGVYHSAYDSYDWMSRFGDPGYLSHAAAGALGAVMLARLANADVEPFDYVSYGQGLDRLVTANRKLAAGKGWTLAYGGLDSAVAEFTREGGRFNSVRSSTLAVGVKRERLAAVNALLRTVEQQLTRPEGLVGRRWMRNLIYASDVDNGYATMALPSIAEAIRADDRRRAAAEVADLAVRVRAAAANLGEASEALGGKTR